MKTLSVDLGDRSYPIYIGHHLLQQKGLLSQHIRGKQVMIVSNTTVAPLYLHACKQQLNDFTVAEVILPDGEEYKTLDTLNVVFDALLQQRFDRSCTLIALGGGVVGDITGFAAASYQRGVDFVQIPTTLLAQVDSSVGGKTGVNHALGKNMIGAFYQPRCVLADSATLDTLEDRELSAGIAEVIKYGLIRDSRFFAWLEQNMSGLLKRDAVLLIEAIYQSCAHKAEVVAADEKESGQRALLNLGHTFGHAIENAMGYGNWLHGEAVAAGMVMAADLSARLQWIDRASVDRIIALLKSAHLPTQAPADMSPQQFLDLMAVDKKVKNGVINLVLLKALGQAVVDNSYSRDLLMETISHSVNDS